MRKRILALLLALAICIVMLASCTYIAREMQHHCCGEHCQICYWINMCVFSLKALSAATAMIVILASLIPLLLYAREIYLCGVPSFSLVSLKVKLSD